MLFFAPPPWQLHGGTDGQPAGLLHDILHWAVLLIQWARHFTLNFDGHYFCYSMSFSCVLFKL